MSQRRPQPSGSRDEEAEEPTEHHFPAYTEVSLRRDHPKTLSTSLGGTVASRREYHLTNLAALR